MGVTPPALKAESVSSWNEEKSLLPRDLEVLSAKQTRIHRPRTRSNRGQCGAQHRQQDGKRAAIDTRDCNPEFGDREHCSADRRP